MAENESIDARYEIVGTVNAGTRASVVQAIDRVHERLVALKIYPVGNEDRASLLAEARTLMGIEPHPALPVVRGDFFTPNDEQYVLVMNWIDGRNLQDILDDDGDPGLAFREVIHDLDRVASALDHLHAHDPAVIHGDVKPDNIIRTASGQIVLVDFDLAGSLVDQRRAGTIGFVAPEVLAGSKPGPQADVYGLAATAMTLLSGQPPTDSSQNFPGLDLITQGQVARVLSRALTTDPQKRPPTAGALITALRAAASVEHPSGVVTLLAFEVTDAARLWKEDPDEMTVALRRLGAVRDEVMEHHGGHVVTSMNEADRTIVVFRDSSSAALAALQLHDRLADQPFPPGFDLQVRAAVAIGEATLDHGVYMGAVVDHVLRLRTIADPGTTVASESTAELLVGLVGPEMSIVPLGTVEGPELGPVPVFALTPSGAEDAVRRRPAGQSNPPADGVVIPTAAPDDTVTLRSMVLEAAMEPATMVAITLFGFALIYDAVLSGELGFAVVARAIMVLAAVVAIAHVAWSVRQRQAAHRAASALDAERREAEERARQAVIDRVETRQRISIGFTRLGSADGGNGIRVLDSLAEEFDASMVAFERSTSRPSLGWTTSLPDLVSETYRHGMSALSDALELFESAAGSRRRRLEGELVEIDERLALDRYDDVSEQRRDLERQASHRVRLAKYVQSRDRALELVFEAERCTAAIADARIELASLRAGDTHVDVDVVVQTLEQTINRVRRVQDAVRRLDQVDDLDGNYGRRTDMTNTPMQDG